MQLAFPWALLLLFAPLCARLLPPRRVQGQSIELPEALARQARPVAGPHGRRGLLLLAAIWACLCLSLARPQYIEMVTDRSATGRDIVLALDMSGSMETADFFLDGQTITRLAAVKRVAERFIRARSGDRFGLVIFADRAYVAAPLTFDLQSVARALGDAEIGISGRSTNISEGLGLSLKKLLAEPSSSKVVILLSDGRDTAKLLDARQVGVLAAEQNIRIHTVALGPEDLETRPAARDAVDTATLRGIAEASGGESFRVKSLTDLQAMAAALDQIEPNPADRPPVAAPKDLWIWPAGLALLLALAAAWVREL